MKPARYFKGLFKPQVLLSLAILGLLAWILLFGGADAIANVFEKKVLPPGVSDDICGITLTMSNGETNVSGTAGVSVTTEDYYNDDKDSLTFYSADANIEDGNEYAWNITIDRACVKEASQVKISCNFPDKEISGIAADNLIEKTAGKVDADIAGAGIAKGNNVVWKYVSFVAGTSSATVRIKADQEETYHDGMTDMDSYVDMVCTVTDENELYSKTATTRVIANS